MKKFILLLGIVFLMFSCTQAPAPADDVKEDLSKENVALVKELINAYQTEDVEKIKSLLSDSVVIWGPGGETVGIENVMKEMNGTFEALDSIKFDVFAKSTESIEEGELAGDYVLLWSTVMAYNVKFEKSFKIEMHNVYKVADGKILMEGNYYDRVTMFKQLGYKIVPPEGFEKEKKEKTEE